MSYILDALKKAERERGIAKVPTLSTVHDLRKKPPVRLWAASCIVVLCMAVFIWLFFFGLDSGEEATPLLAEEAIGVADGLSVAQAKPAAPVDESSFSAGSSEPLTSTGLESSSKMPALADEARIKIADSGGQRRSTGEREVIQSSRRALDKRGAPENRTAISDRAEAVALPDESTPRNSIQELAELPPMQPEIEPARVAEPQASAGTAGEGRISLRDAVDKMKMSVLYYSDSKAERLVFINGRKYVEGDTIEGVYLLESITSEGAVLSYNGERAMLRPGRN